MSYIWNWVILQYKHGLGGIWGLCWFFYTRICGKTQKYTHISLALYVPTLSPLPITMLDRGDRGLVLQVVGSLEVTLVTSFILQMQKNACLEAGAPYQAKRLEHLIKLRPLQHCVVKWDFFFFSNSALKFEYFCIQLFNMLKLKSAPWKLQLHYCFI